MTYAHSASTTAWPSVSVIPGAYRATLKASSTKLHPMPSAPPDPSTWAPAAPHTPATHRVHSAAPASIECLTGGCGACGSPASKHAHRSWRFNREGWSLWPKSAPTGHHPARRRMARQNPASRPDTAGALWHQGERKKGTAESTAKGAGGITPPGRRTGSRQHRDRGRRRGPSRDDGRATRHPTGDLP